MTMKKVIIIPNKCNKIALNILQLRFLIRIFNNKPRYSGLNWIRKLLHPTPLFVIRSMNADRFLEMGLLGLFDSLMN